MQQASQRSPEAPIGTESPGPGERVSHLLRQEAWRGWIALLVALLFAIILPATFEERSLIFYDVTALVYVLLTWLVMYRLSSEETATWAQNHPRPARGIWRWVLRLLGAYSSRTAAVVYIGMVAVSGLLLAVYLLPGFLSQEEVGRAAVPLSAFGVLLSWLLLHTSFGLYYAHLYYDAPERPGGLAFPGDEAFA